MDEIEVYYDGFPKEVGWYDVIVDGIEERLLHRYCYIENRHKWQDINGCEVKGNVKWTGDVSATP